MAGLARRLSSTRCFASSTASACCDLAEVQQNSAQRAGFLNNGEDEDEFEDNDQIRRHSPADGLRNRAGQRRLYVLASDRLHDRPPFLAAAVKPRRGAGSLKLPRRGTDWGIENDN